MIAIPLLITIAWGALAFGAVYQWTYIPLGGACAVIGIAGLFPRGDLRLGRVNAPIILGLVLVGLVAIVQLVPLPRETLMKGSPATDAFLRKYDLQYHARSQVDASRGRGSVVGGEASRGDVKTPNHPMSIDPPATKLGLALLGVFGLFLVGITRGLTSRDVRQLVPMLVALGVVLALAGLITKATWSGKIYGLWEPYSPGTDPFGPFVNRNHFAGWMLMALPLGLGYFLALVARGMRDLRPRPGRTKVDTHQRLVWFASSDANRVILVGFGLLVMAVSLVLTFSRSGITCFTIALVLSALLALPRQAKGSKRALIGSYLIVVFALAVGWAGLDAISASFEKIDVDYKQRAAIWQDALTVYHDFPVFGSGLNTFGTAMRVYQTADLSTHSAEAHNDYVQLLSEGGIVMCAAGALFLLLFIREVRRRFKHDTDDGMTYWVRVGAVTGLIAIGLQEAVEFSLQLPGNVALFVTLMGIAAGRLPHRGRRSRDRGSGS